MILCNGAPETGTLLCMHMCALLGLTNTGVFVEDFGNGQMVKHYKAGYPPGLIPLVGEGTIRAHIVPQRRDRIAQGMMRTLHMIRDPRAAAVSMVKSGRLARHGISGDIDGLLRLITQPVFNHANWIDLHGHFADQRQTSQVMLIRFESIMTTRAVADIAKFIHTVSFDAQNVLESLKGKKLPPMVFHERPSQGQSSRWQDWWTSEVETAWNDNNGQEILRRIGYS